MPWPLSPRSTVLAGLAIAALAWWAAPEPEPVETGPFAPPRQRPVEEVLELPAPEGFRITALDHYSMDAMVMSRKRYRWDTQAELAPVDLQLAWGQLTVEPNLGAIRYRQDSRWGNITFDRDEVEVTPGEINLSTANTHMIPAQGDRQIRSALLGARRGDVLRLQGYLVRVDGPDGWAWVSSRSRGDFGNHACELFYVTGVERLDADDGASD